MASCFKDRSEAGPRTCATNAVGDSQVAAPGMYLLVSVGVDGILPVL